MAILERAENRTFSGFILPQSKALASLNDLTVAIQKERLAWQSSGAAENFALLWGELYEKHPEFKNPLPHELVVKNKKTSLYTDQTQVKGDANAVFNRLRSQMSAGLKAEVDELIALELEHTTHYRESVKPFVQEKDKVTESLIVNWLDFMTEAPSNFHDFSIFMEADENLEQRENIRPFLQALENYRAVQQSRGKDAIESTKKLVVDNCLANPGTDDLQALVDDIVKNEKPEWSKLKITGSLFQWMQLLSGGQDINSSLIINRIFELQILPSDLEAYFKSSLEYTLGRDVMTIKRSLGDFKPEKVRLLSMDFSSLTKMGHRKDRYQAFKPSKEVNTPAEESKPSIDYLSNFDEGNTAEDYVRGKVRTARTDASLREDLVEILKQVERDPYGIGAGKLKNDSHYVTGKNGRRIYQMYYKPSRLPGFILETQEAYRYRPIYHIEETSETQRLVVIDDLPHHDRFDQDYN